MIVALVWHTTHWMRRAIFINKAHPLELNKHQVWASGYFKRQVYPVSRQVNNKNRLNFWGSISSHVQNSFADLSSSRAMFCRHCGLQSTLKISVQFSEINNTKTYQRATTNNRYYCIQLWTAERKKWNWTGKYDVFYFHHMPRTHAEMDRIINITFHFQNVHLSGMYSSI